MFELCYTPKSPLQEIQPNSFVYEWRNALDIETCNKMIAQFEAHEEEHNEGRVSWGLKRPELKRSTDLYLRGQEHWKWADEILFNSLNKAIDEMSKLHPLFEEDTLEDTGYQIQRTLPGEFYHWHKDLNQHSRKRVLVFIWYLNDVPQEAGGATGFKHQDLFIQPEAGKLILFPPYWTHVHRGGVLKSGIKYLCTGWVSYVGADDSDGITITFEDEE